MKLHRILAIVYRYLIDHNSIDRLGFIFYWPLLDIVLWFFASTWLSSQTTTGIALIASAICWQIILRAQNDVGLNLLEEIQYHNISNLFATPLKLSEWIAATMIIGIVMNSISTITCSTFAWLISGFNILSFGWHLIPILFGLYLSGLVMGYIVASILIYTGMQAQSFAYMIGWFFSIFGGVFCPPDLLPLPLQFIARLLPISYIFTTIRTLAIDHFFNWSTYSTGILLNGLYLIVVLLIFNYAFRKSCKKGLARLVD